MLWSLIRLSICFICYSWYLAHGCHFFIFIFIIYLSFHSFEESIYYPLEEFHMLLLCEGFNVISISLQALECQSFSKEFTESSDDPNCSITRDQSPGTYCFFNIFCTVSCWEIFDLLLCWSSPPLQSEAQQSTLKIFLFMKFHQSVTLGWFPNFILSNLSLSHPTGALI